MSSSVGSSSLYGVSTSSSSSSGISHLVSGMDTDSMVKKMLSGTQKQINAQDAKRQQTEWTQDIYREIITSINTFKGNYFNTSYDASSTNNLSSNAFFNSMVSKVKSGDALSIVSTDTSASTGDYSISVKQLATQAALTSAQKVSGSQIITGTALTSDTLTSLFSKNVTLKVGAASVAVDLSSATTQDQMLSAFNNALTSSGVTGVTAKVYGDKLRFVTDSASTSVSVDTANSSTLGLTMTGLTSAASSTVTGADGTAAGNMLQGSELDLTAGYSIDLTLDGVKKSINLNNVGTSTVGGKTVVTPDNVAAALQTQVKKAFGDYVTVSLDSDNKINFAINIKDSSGNLESGHELIVTGADAKKIGITPGTASHISSSSTLSELGAAGDRYQFTINGTQFSFTGDDTVASMLNKVNNSDIGVTMSYSSVSDTFSLKASSTGSKYGIELSQQEGDLLSKMFGSGTVATASKAVSSELTTSSIQGTALASDYSVSNASLTMNVDGKDYTFSLAATDTTSSYDKAAIESAFNSWLSSTFGSTSGTANMSYADGKLSINNGSVVKFDATAVDTDNAAALAAAKKTDLALAMGFDTTATSNIATASTAISDVYQLKGMDASLFTKADGTAASTLSELASVNGSAMTYSDGRLALTGSGTVDLSAQQKLVDLFGSSSIALGDGTMASGAVTAGQDAIVLVDGVETSRSSNVFTLDGITMQLNKVSTSTTDSNGNVTYDKTTIGTSRDVDTIVTGLKAFVADYNTMISKLNTYINEDPEYRSYPPLTEEQKSGMTDSQIKLWESKTKVGLVHNDSAITSFLSEMRTALYTKPEDSTVALYDIGIETMTSYTDTDNIGKLQLDETKLRSAIASDPDSVRNLFTNTTDGLAAKLTQVMKRSANTSSGSPGELVQMAGVKGTATEKNNTLYERITGIKDRISQLKDKYDREKTRYWNQFTTMESVLSQYSTQSAYLTQQFSS